MDNNSQTIALDVYGTLINTSGVLSWLRKNLGEKAEPFSEIWRTKQLEYSFRRGLMDRYVDFSIVTKEALEYTSLALNIQLNASEQAELLHQYRILPAFEDVIVGVENLKAAGHQVYAYSNGSHKAVAELLEQAKVLSLLNGVVSMEDVRTFKPDPIGYRHFCDTTRSEVQHTWMVSGNNFDAIGARSFGMQTAWLKRNPSGIFDPMGFEPTISISTLSDLARAIDQFLIEKKHEQ